MDTPKKIFTVSELNRQIKTILENAYPKIWLEGEISNFRAYESGHMYFSLKDDESQISAVIFYGINRNIKFKIENGLKVLVRGTVSAYSKKSEYQIIIDLIEPKGIGALQLAFEQLKEKLEKEGLFKPERKKPIPILPQKIGIVTSPIGAAIKDILTVLNRRFANLEILIYPVRVQGEEAKFDISSAIEFLNKNYPKLDVILVGRGGGSMEDLWAFNEEIVVRAIANSKIPIISCVGHEIDFTIADFVADLRAPTPSAAAELVVRNKIDLVEKLENLQGSLVRHMQFMLANYNETLKRLVISPAITKPSQIFVQHIQEIDDLHNRIIESAKEMIQDKRDNSRTLFEKLNLLSPLNILKRGYSLCWLYPDKIILKDTKKLKINDSIKVRLSKGELLGRVEKLLN